jgi:outer membrane biosynthesis protein TonB
MARLSAALLTLALGAAVVLGLAACGSGGDAELLPGETASEITANLDQVEQLASEGDCAGAAATAEAVSAQVEALGGVDAKLKEALSEGARRLNEVVAGCEEATTEEEPAIEPAEEPEEAEKKEKPAKPEKPKKEEAEEEPEEETEPTLPPQAEGKAKGHETPEEEVPPPSEDGGTPSGGVGAAEPAGSE